MMNFFVYMWIGSYGVTHKVVVTHDNQVELWNKSDHHEWRQNTTNPLQTLAFGFERIVEHNKFLRKDHLEAKEEIKLLRQELLEMHRKCNLTE